MTGSMSRVGCMPLLDCAGRGRATARGLAGRRHTIAEGRPPAGSDVKGAVQATPLSFAPPAGGKGRGPQARAEEDERSGLGDGADVEGPYGPPGGAHPRAGEVHPE